MPARGIFTAEVVENKPLCREHFRLTLRLGSFPPTAPGQFVQVLCRDDSDATEAVIEWSPGEVPKFNRSDGTARNAGLRRPFSLAGRRDRPDGSVELDLIHRVVGVGTDWLARRVVGDSVSVLGPLGNRFTPPPPGSVALLVGGGVGIPPMIYLASTLTDRKAVAFAGAVTRDLLSPSITADGPPPGLGDVTPRYNVAEFAAAGVPAVVSTDDGTYGFRGYVTQALEQYLDDYPIHQEVPTVIYTCGPEVMMKRVAMIAAARSIDCQVAVERAMACGMGTCQSCCIKVTKDDPAAPPLPGSEWAWRLACTDGPVFAADKLRW